MRLLPSRRVSGRVWWGLFALLIAAPALALAWLGLRAVRADRLEAEERVRAQQRQVARLADIAIQNALAQLESDSIRRHAGRPPAKPEAGRNVTLVVFHRSGLVTFPSDRIYFGPFGRMPRERAALTGWPSEIAALTDEAQALEVQGRPAEAALLFARIGRAEPRLQSWSAIVAARTRLPEPSAVERLASAEWARSDGVTPSGLPAALVAAGASESQPPRDRARFRALIRATLEGLRAGRWWLSADERRFYDGRLRGLLQPERIADDGPDARLVELSEMDGLVRQFAPSRRNGPTRVVERGPSTAYLMVWTPSDEDADAWLGAFIAQGHAGSLLGPTFERLLAGQPFTGAVRGVGGETLWKQAGALPVAWHTERLVTFADWELTFGPPDADGVIARRQWLWYGFISLLLLTLLAGVGMTAHVVRREMELTRRQTEFVGAVTHEFKSPITSIRLLLERVVSGRVSAQQSAASYYAAIGQETDRLERLVNRLLEAQQIDAGQRRYAFEPGSLEEIAAAVVRHLQPTADAKNIRVDLETGGVPSVAMDRAAIADAIENLVDNAIKYSRSGTRVLVRLHAEGDRVSVDVSDQGIGIERDELPRVFDKFYRAHRGDLQSVRGTGLGLALVKAAAEAHGGSVDVESEPGVGSRFSLKLPA